MPGRLQLLLVEDDELLRRALRHQLAATAEVETASCMAEALNVLASRTFDVVLTDFEMPAGNGVALLEQVRSLQPGARRFLMSGAKAPVPAGPGELVHAFLAKPFTTAELQQLIVRFDRA